MADGSDSLGSLFVQITGDFSELSEAISQATTAASDGAEQIANAFNAEGSEQLTTAFTEIGSTSQEASEKIQQFGESTATAFDSAESSAAEAATAITDVGTATTEAASQSSDLSELATALTDIASEASSTSGDIDDVASSAQEASTAASDAADALQEFSTAADDAASGVGSLEGDTEGLSGDLSDTEGSAHDAAEGVEEFGESASEAGEESEGAGEGVEEMLGELAAMAGVALTAEGALEAVKEVVTEAIAAFANVQVATVALTALTGSANEAHEVIESLESLAQQDSLSFPSLVTAAQRMEAFGVSTDDIVPALNAAGNASYATGNDFDTVAQRMGTMALSGTVATRSLAALGISLSQVGDALGVSADEATKAFKALGDPDERIQALITAMGNIPPVAQQMSTTVTGAFVDLKNQAHFTFDAIGAVLAPAATAMEEYATGVLKDVQNTIEAFGQLGTAVGQALSEVLQALGVSSGQIDALMSAAGASASASFTASFASGFKALTAIIQGAVSLIQSEITVFENIYTTLTGKSLTMASDIQSALDKANQASADYNTTLAATAIAANQAVTGSTAAGNAAEAAGNQHATAAPKIQGVAGAFQSVGQTAAEAGLIYGPTLTQLNAGVVKIVTSAGTMDQIVPKALKDVTTSAQDANVTVSQLSTSSLQAGESFDTAGISITRTTGTVTDFGTSSSDAVAAAHQLVNTFYQVADAASSAATEVNSLASAESDWATSDAGWMNEGGGGGGKGGGGGASAEAIAAGIAAAAMSPLTSAFVEGFNSTQFWQSMANATGQSQGGATPQPTGQGTPGQYWGLGPGGTYGWQTPASSSAGSSSASPTSVAATTTAVTALGNAATSAATATGNLSTAATTATNSGVTPLGNAAVTAASSGVTPLGNAAVTAATAISGSGGLSDAVTATIPVMETYASQLGTTSVTAAQLEQGTGDLTDQQQKYYEAVATSLNAQDAYTEALNAGTDSQAQLAQLLAASYNAQAAVQDLTGTAQVASDTAEMFSTQLASTSVSAAQLEVGTGDLTAQQQQYYGAVADSINAQNAYNNALQSGTATAAQLQQLQAASIAAQQTVQDLTGGANVGNLDTSSTGPLAGPTTPAPTAPPSGLTGPAANGSWVWDYVSQKWVWQPQASGGNVGGSSNFAGPGSTSAYTPTILSATGTPLTQAAGPTSLTVNVNAGTVVGQNAAQALVNLVMPQMVAQLRQAGVKI